MLLKAKAILADRINTDLFSMSDKPYFVEHKAVDIIIYKLLVQALEDITAAKFVARYVNTSKSNLAR
ncbi:hypothetical protein H4J45_13060 [Colwellia sp. BRX10-6]|uniref:hypothetical protein n=1 Tax=unclassified Colwellia TaxID=196834 RepID=UPI0015F37B27|nr:MULTISPECIES: hypothetical protein [unclassified Colwellia]MBA6384599.1 hypothetical protein [Colwellia sp. BRX10-9]MBA6395017.1 hypothetical protein [Colwellia sp. BRX10-6]|tara:strand:+ start:4795 stop:4995 length:201 start_codon:yes stop_codon:yes gene_type:complete